MSVVVGRNFLLVNSGRGVVLLLEVEFFFKAMISLFDIGRNIMFVSLGINFLSMTDTLIKAGRN